MPHPLVSILIPTYNRAHFLECAVKSAVAQTYTNIEILILDDASPDHTPEVPVRFTNDPRVRYIRHEQNIGIVNNWKLGIKAASGDFFCLLHDDDTFDCAFIETLLSPLLCDPELILSFCDQYAIDKQGKRMVGETEELSKRFRRDILPHGHVADLATTALINASIPVGAALFRKSMVDLSFLDERAKGSIDAWLFYQCFATGFGSYYISERLMNYRIHDGGMSASMPLYMSEGHLFRYRSMLSDPRLVRIHQAVQRKLSEALISYGIELVVQGKRQEARQYLAEGLNHGFSCRGAIAYGFGLSGTLGTKSLQIMRGKR